MLSATLSPASGGISTLPSNTGLPTTSNPAVVALRTAPQPTPIISAGTRTTAPLPSVPLGPVPRPNVATAGQPSTVSTASASGQADATAGTRAQIISPRPGSSSGDFVNLNLQPQQTNVGVDQQQNLPGVSRPSFFSRLPWWGWALGVLAVGGVGFAISHRR